MFIQLISELKFQEAKIERIERNKSTIIGPLALFSTLQVDQKNQ